MNNLKKFAWLDWIVLGVFALISAGTAGMSMGHIQETRHAKEKLAISAAVELKTQYDLGKLDFDAGRYEIARQRFEFILGKNPDYPGAMDLLTQTLLQLTEDNVGATLEVPKPSITPTPTLSPTPDNRAVEEIFDSANVLFNNLEWRSLVQTLLALRDHDPLFQVSEVDRMLYLAHYFNGIEKIMVDGDLEGGLYDLSLAELFVPLDAQAEIYREWARLYQIGMSFWAVYPDQSVYYFSQLAAAAPYLKDLSGIAAITRYQMALVMYGDTLAQSGDWCGAAEQYNLAQQITFDSSIEAKVIEINEQCQYSIATPTFTMTITWTPSSTPTMGGVTWTATLSSSSTATIDISLTLTPTATTEQSTPTPTTQAPASETPTTTPSPTTDANTPTATNTASATMVPTATETVPTETPSPTPTVETEP
jgi:tetratricopeptide (TPR) repeat protein